MKKIVLTIATIFAFGVVNAQKGSVLVAGNVSIDSWKQGDAKTSGFEFSPKVGYQFSDNMTVGLDAGISSNKNADKDKTDTTKLGAFLRYAKPLGGAYSIYADLGLGMKNEKFTPDGGDSSKANGFYAGITPAVFIDLKNSFGLNFSIGGLSYDSMKADVSGAEAANTLNLNFGKQVNIGISKNF